MNKTFKRKGTTTGVVMKSANLEGSLCVPVQDNIHQDSSLDSITLSEVDIQSRVNMQSETDHMTTFDVMSHSEAPTLQCQKAAYQIAHWQ